MPNNQNLIRIIKRLVYSAALPLCLLGAPLTLQAAPAIVASDAGIEIVDDNEISQPGYLVLDNTSDKELILVRARASAFGLIMIHQAAIDHGVVRMLLKQDLVLPAGKKTVLDAKGVHLMFAGRKVRQKAGEKTTVTLVFNDGSQLPVEFEWRKPSRR